MMKAHASVTFLFTHTKLQYMAVISETSAKGLPSL